MVQLNGETKDNNKYNNVLVTRNNVPILDISPNLSTNNLKQFASAYTTRLSELSKDLATKAERKWNKPVVSLANLENFKGDSCIIIGTLYKHQQWKPSILRELCEEDQLILSESRPNYCSDSDQLFLEDDTSRIRLIGEKLNLHGLVTGVVAAALGYENENSKFEVQDWCFPGCPLQVQIRSRTVGKLLLISDLKISESYNKLSTKLLVEWLLGLSGNTLDQEESASVIQVIIAGNGRTENDKKDEKVSYNSNSINSAGLMNSSDKLDTFISELAKTCYVTFMPGDGDVTSIMMPQQKLHPCLFPKSRKYETFIRATNPYISRIETRIITGSSGQPIHDIIKACGNGSCLNWLEQTLNWRHLCPTCPDTLPSYPCFENGDVMIMEECPDIYFAGNMDNFETKLWQGDEGQKVRLISIPSFCRSQTAVIVDLASLDVQTMTFGSN